jgi:S-ribosylhomocysteine lyase LuxS involved in autoinducer biosynthesis
LYDKTFPPRPATAKVAMKSNFGTNVGMAGHDEMRQFNYYGNIPEEEEIEAADIDKLEHEIAEVLKNRANGE